MDHEPLVSVVIPAYQRAGSIRRAVDSALAQQGVSLEVIVADDGSTDGTAESLERLEDPRLRVLRLPHAGRSAARNSGAAAARGELLAFLDSDDEALTDWLATLTEPFGDPQVDLVCAGVRIHYARPGLGPPRELVRLPRDLGPIYDHGRGFFLPGAFAVRRRLFTEIGGYSPELAFAENTELALRLVPLLVARNRRIVNIPRPVILMHNTRSAGDAPGHLARLEAARFILERHGERYRRVPSSYANYCGVAGVNASRLGRHAEALRWFSKAVRVWPWRLAPWFRLALALVPPLARRWWARHPESE